ncbi:aspartyl-tRNA synthetase [Metschnikowia aff. pulcherrima]|uniref:Aspartyl-tRNA synthetase n=1 Tax=Metschnikowia aff. pulcherrima TaxID=2163413 RepID=A0A4V1AE52_9ASCO|nr:aspartyl-tRNA synthetase [Metschnikowia aff. pulcherrima]
MRPPIITRLIKYPVHARPLVTRRYLSKLPSRETTLAKFVFPSATHCVRDIRGETTEAVTLHGHLHKKPRVQAKRTFAELRDVNGDTIQILLSPESTSSEFFSLIEKSGPEDSVSVTGHIKKKQAKIGAKGVEFEVVVSHLQVLNSAGVEAARLDKLKHASPADIPAKYRYLQLRTPFYQNALKTRSKVANLIRNTLIEKHNFTEIETPLLFKSTPEGAREFLVPTRSPSRLYALPQSPQQYKQILMSSGFSRYFQLAKCFRDEDLRADRQPEFTQVDLEMSFVNTRDQVTAVVDDIIQKVWKETSSFGMYRLGSDGYLHEIPKGESDSVPFAKLTYMEALSGFGIDKPDLRSNLQFVDISEFFEPGKHPKDFPVVEACVLKNAFKNTEPFRIPHSLTDSASYSKRKPVVVKISSVEDAEKWFEKFCEKGLIIPKSGFTAAKLLQKLGLEPGDVLAFSTRAELPYENPTPLGKFRQLAIEEFPGKWNRPIAKCDGTFVDDYKKSEIFVGLWVVDFPLFSPVELDAEPNAEFPVYSTGDLLATHHPFTMAKSEDYEMLESSPLKVRGEHYDLVINGVEVGGGSRRIHDPELQQYVFENILKIRNHEALFGHLLKALLMGCPPHAGLALGFDRLCAMLIGSQSIRDVIAFPKNQSGSDPVVDSPTDVPDATLREYHLQKAVK